MVDEAQCETSDTLGRVSHHQQILSPAQHEEARSERKEAYAKQKQEAQRLIEAFKKACGR